MDKEELKPEDLASKKACERLREVFGPCFESKGAPKIDFSNDAALIEEFKDEWTWFMQGWKDTSESLQKTISDQQQRISELEQELKDEVGAVEHMKEITDEYEKKICELEEANRKGRELLETALNGLLWYCDSHPEDFSQTDLDVQDEIKTFLDSPPIQEQQTKE